MEWSRVRNAVVRLTICTAAVVGATAALDVLPVGRRLVVAALVLLFLVLVVAAVWGFRYAVYASLVAGVGFCWLTPPHRLWINDSRDLAALAAFLVIAIVGSHLSERARREALNAEQRRAEAVAAQQRFADLVNSVEGIVWESDADTLAFSFVSQQAERILGYPVDRWLREPTFWKDHVHPDDTARAADGYVKARIDGRSCDIEYRMIAADGTVVWLRDLVTVVVEGGGPNRLRGVMVDITQRKRAEQERERLHQLQDDLARINRVTTMGELTASLAHEINQPLAAIVTNANACVRWLAGAKPNVDEARDAAGRIARDANRAGEMIARIRLLFKKGARRDELVDVNEVIAEILALLHGEATRSGVFLRTEVASHLPRVTGDRVQLQQVLMNLAMNGIDAMRTVEAPRELTVSSHLDGSDRVLVSVTDTGVGLPREKEQIFDAFYTTKPHGTGMGLAISRTIVESHGGRLWAASNPNRGAIFHFTLPANGPDGSGLRARESG